MSRFERELRERGLALKRGPLQTLQINVGRKCNQACRHCHVDAGPWRTEILTRPVAERIAGWIARFRPPVVDITGGAPELSEFFQYLVEGARAAGCRVLDRCNLTIIHEPGYEDLPFYLSKHQVESVAKQRGQGVFERSIAARQRLNAVGYEPRLPPHLVYNPVGPKLPGP